MPNCPDCGAEVDEDQVVCAWCGADVESTPKPKPKPRAENMPTGMDGEAWIDADQADGEVDETKQEDTSLLQQLRTAQAMAKNKDYRGAQQLFEDILQRDSTILDALFGLGAVYYKLEQFEQALQAWQKLHKLNPTYPKITGWITKARSQIQVEPKHSVSEQQRVLEEFRAADVVAETQPSPEPVPEPVAPTKQEPEKTVTTHQGYGNPAGKWDEDDLTTTSDTLPELAPQFLVLAWVITLLTALFVVYLVMQW